MALINLQNSVIGSQASKKNLKAPGPVALPKPEPASQINHPPSPPIATLHPPPTPPVATSQPQIKSSFPTQVPVQVSHPPQQPLPPAPQQTQSFLHQISGSISIEPPAISDASEDFWPCHTIHLPSWEMRNKKGLVRIDDFEANGVLEESERNRRKASWEYAMGILGKGLVLHHKKEKKAAKKGVPFESLLLPHCRANYRGGRVQRCGVRFETTVPAFLADLPQGYAMFNGRRPSSQEHFDIYIYGSEKGEFDSIISFIPHLYWLIKGQREDVPCRCKLCCQCVHCITECSGCERPTDPDLQRRRRSESPSPSPPPSPRPPPRKFANSGASHHVRFDESTFAPVAGLSSVAKRRNWSSISDDDMDISD